MGKTVQDVAEARLKISGYEILESLPGNEAVKLVARDEGTGETVFVAVRERSVSASLNAVAIGDPARIDYATVREEIREWERRRGTAQAPRFDEMLVALADSAMRSVMHCKRCAVDGNESIWPKPVRCA